MSRPESRVAEPRRNQNGAVHLSGGSIINRVIATGVLTNVGWLGRFETTSVPYGTCTMARVATDALGPQL
jgi:hypothetical protein